MNFNAVYQSALQKVFSDTVTNGSDKFLDILESKIVNTPALTKQYIIFETLKKKEQGLSEEDAKNFILYVEKYCSNLNYDDLEKANHKFLKEFNINPKSIKAEAFDESIDELIRICSGGTALLFNEGKYRKTLLDHYTGSPTEKLHETTTPTFEFKALSPSMVLEVASSAVSEAYNKLTESQQDVIELTNNGNRDKLKTKIQMVEARSRTITKGADKTMINGSIAKLKEDANKSDIRTVLEKTQDLQKVVMQLLENKYGGPAEIKFPDLNYLHYIRANVVEDKNRPDTIEIQFRFDVYPATPTYYAMRSELQDIDKRLGRVSRTFINQTIFRENSPYKSFFTGEGIWDSTVRTESVQPGESSTARVNWIVYTTRVEDKGAPGEEGYQEGQGPSFEELKKPILELLRELDAKIVEIIPEADPNFAQTSDKAAGAEPAQARPSADDGEDDTYNKPNPDDVAAPDKEPSAGDIEDIERDMESDDDEPKV